MSPNFLLDTLALLALIGVSGFMVYGTVLLRRPSREHGKGGGRRGRARRQA